LKNNLRGVGFYILVIVILVATLAVLYGNNTSKQMYYSDVIDLFKQEKVESFTIDGNVFTAKIKDQEALVTAPIAYISLFYEDTKDLIADQKARGIIKNYDYTLPDEAPWWASIIPYVILIIIFAVMWFFVLNQSGGGSRTMNFGKAKTRTVSDQQKKVTFEDVAGADEEKAELSEIVDFLKNPKKYIDIGARIPKGVLLVGPPGTGKTLIAKAVAGEAGVPFLSISGSDFVEMFVGVGASRVRDLFDQAKKNSPSIVFIDEIDAVGRHRGAGLGGGHDEREQTLNQLLVEMDGFGVNEGVIIIAATNRADILDPALLRPGRFDRHVYVGMPDIKGRESILKVHARGKPFEPDVSLATLAKTTAGFTGADLENLLNEAALLAARQNRTKISNDDLLEALVKVVAGPEKKSRVIPEKEKKITAYHEAGHAVVSRELPNHDPVHEISIIPRGSMGGYTMYLPKEDSFQVSRNEMLDSIVSLLGGRVSEALNLNDISAGASNDIERATGIARSMVTKYGMSDELGPISFDSPSEEVFLGRDFATNKHISEQVSSQIDAEIKKIITSAYTRCEDILRKNSDKVKEVADYLLEHEKMDSETFNALFEGLKPALDPSPSPDDTGVPN
jgi:cell division protease FtsH